MAPSMCESDNMPSKRRGRGDYLRLTADLVALVYWLTLLVFDHFTRASIIIGGGLTLLMYGGGSLLWPIKGSGRQQRGISTDEGRVRGSGDQSQSSGNGETGDGNGS